MFFFISLFSPTGNLLNILLKTKIVTEIKTRNQVPIFITVILMADAIFINSQEKIILTVYILFFPMWLMSVIALHF